MDITATVAAMVATHPGAAAELAAIQETAAMAAAEMVPAVVAVVVEILATGAVVAGVWAS
jgi:hypothetical protein